MILEIIGQISPFSFPAVLGLGLIIGLQHALEADHIVAVNTQIAKSKFSKNSFKDSLTKGLSKSSIIGILWGAGHTSALVVMGIMAYFLAIQSQIFLGFELLVGIMLVFLGFLTLLNRKKILKIKPRHPHKHTDGTIHFDTHEHTTKDQSTVTNPT